MKIIKAYIRHFCHLFIKDSNLCTVFEVERFKENKWITEIFFMRNDIRDADIENDWRWCEVKGKRKQAKVLGIYRAKFPIKFPMLFINGLVINKDDYYMSNSNKEY